MAIDELLDEHEQSRRVQEWLRSNGGGLLGGILLGLAAVGGWKWWQQHLDMQSMQAAETYQSAVDAAPASVGKGAAALKSVPDGTYRSLAALTLAQVQVDAGHADVALATLQQSRPDDPSLRAVADRRIAGLQIETGKAADALKTLQGHESADEEMRGDAWFALGKPDQARESYRKALVATDEGSPQRKLLELKYMQVGGVPASPKTP